MAATLLAIGCGRSDEPVSAAPPASPAALRPQPKVAPGTIDAVEKQEATVTSAEGDAIVRPPQFVPHPDTDNEKKESPGKTVPLNDAAPPSQESAPFQRAETEKRIDLEQAARPGAKDALLVKGVASKPHPREVVERKSRGSLPFLMQECGYRWGYVYADDLDSFVKAAIEPAQTGAVDGRIRIGTTVYRIPMSDKAQREVDLFRLRHEFGTKGKSDAEAKIDRSDEDEIAIQMALPFRLYKSDSTLDRERTKGVKGVGSVAVNRADPSTVWFLTKDDRLASCTPQEAQIVMARGGSLYFGESRRSKLIFRGLNSNPHAQNLRNLPYNDFDPKQHAAQSIVCEIEIERLTYGPALDWQESWGYYRREAMVSEEMDSDFIVNWNVTGALTGMTPDYFRPTKSANPVVVSAKLVSAILRTSAGEVVASYHRD